MNRACVEGNHSKWGIMVKEIGRMTPRLPVRLQDNTELTP